MRILYVSGTYYPATGGGELSMHTLLSELRRRGNSVHVFTDVVYDDDCRSGEEHVVVHSSPHASREENLDRLLSADPPDVVLTQLMWADVALRACRRFGVPSVFRANKIPFLLNLGTQSKYCPTAIISVSRAVQEYVRAEHGRLSTVLPPAISIRRLEVPPSSSGFITMVNPLKRKGGCVFRELASMCPGRRFAVVHGWSMLRASAETLDFSEELVRRMAESLGSEYSGGRPEFARFEDLMNVAVLPSTNDITEIHAKTSILLVPSQWEETYGRVALEAMMNGVPVAASRVGGLADVVGEGGVLVDDFSSPEAWLRAIETIESDHDGASRRAEQWAAHSYCLDDVVKRTEEFLASVCDGRTAATDLRPRVPSGD